MDHPRSRPPLEAFLDFYWQDIEAGRVRSIDEYLEMLGGDAGGRHELRSLLASGTIKRKSTFVIGTYQSVDTHAEPKADRTEAGEQGLRIPGYRLISELGRGGMGVVCKAVHEATDQTVALKLMRTGWGSSLQDLARFRFEAGAIAAVAHPNIVKILEVGVSEGFPYFALEYVEGGSLRDELLRGLPDEREAAGWVRLVADALHHAHTRGIIHRDLKPDNILMTRDRVPKVTDFGLARFENWNLAREEMTVLIDPLDFELRRRLPRLNRASQSQSSMELNDLRLTEDGVVMGTLAYMPPEQLMGHQDHVGPRSDIYSLGAVLYETLTGRRPHRFRDIEELKWKVLTTDPRPPGPEIHADLSRICIRCLKRVPEERYESAEDLAVDIDRWLAGRRVAAPSIRQMAREAMDESDTSLDGFHLGFSETRSKTLVRRGLAARAEDVYIYVIMALIVLGFALSNCV